MNLTAEHIKKLLPERKSDAHKGSFSPVFAIGGTVEKEGAIEMTALAALRVGCGLATILSFEKLVHVPLEVMYEKLGFFWKQKLSNVIARGALAPCGDLVIALGPGLGTSRRAAKLTKFIVENFHGPLVIDADALNCLSAIQQPSFCHSDASICHPEPKALASPKQREGGKDRYLKYKAYLPIFTPHAGEFSRLTHYSIHEIQTHREALAVEYAKKWNAIVVLKGEGTVIASPSGEHYVNTTGNPGMATAGMGDVLTGIIAGFLAQGLKPFEAAQLGVYLHGLAGDEVASAKGQRGLIATDIIHQLPKTITNLLNS